MILTTGPRTMPLGTKRKKKPTKTPRQPQPCMAHHRQASHPPVQAPGTAVAARAQAMPPALPPAQTLPAGHPAGQHCPAAALVAAPEASTLVAGYGALEGCHCIQRDHPQIGGRLRYQVLRLLLRLLPLRLPGCCLRFRRQHRLSHDHRHRHAAYHHRD